MTTTAPLEAIDRNRLIESAPQRMVLQRRAQATIRRHWMRAVVRIVVLIGVDLGAIEGLRASVRAVSDGLVFGERAATAVHGLLPEGYLGGWQFAAALLVGLSLSGAYGPGDCRRDARRLFIGISFGVALSLWQSVWMLGPGTTLAQSSPG